MNYGLDIGQNLTTLGLLFLALKFILPIFVGLVLLALGYFALKYLFNEFDIENRNLTYLLLFGLFVILIIIYVL